MGCTACTEPQYLYNGALYLTLFNMLGMNIKVTIFMFHFYYDGTTFDLSPVALLHLRE